MKALLKQKLTSRKFLVCLTSIITGIFLCANGNTAEGVSAIISAVLIYCIAEGLVDAVSAKKVVQTVVESLNKQSTSDENTNGETDGETESSHSPEE